MDEKSFKELQDKVTALSASLEAQTKANEELTTKLTQVETDYKTEKEKFFDKFKFTPMDEKVKLTSGYIAINDKRTALKKELSGLGKKGK